MANNDGFSAAPVDPASPKDSSEVNAGVVVEVGVFRGGLLQIASRSAKLPADRSWVWSGALFQY